MMKSILILDDEDSVRRLIRSILEEKGYECSEASNAAQARELLKTNKFDLILSDINMPGESGLDFIRYCLAEYPDTAIVMVTGINSPLIAREALTIGVYGYIIKPFGNNHILITVDNALRRLGLEKERKHHADNLDALVRERTAELRKSVRELETAKNELQKSEEKYLRENKEKKQLIEAIPSILVGVSGNGSIIQWNATAEEVSSLSAKDVMGKFFSQCGISWDWPRIEKGIFFCKEHKSQVQLDNLCFTKPDGDEGFLGITLAPIISDQKCSGFIFIGADITKLKHARQALRESEERHRILFESSQDAIMTLEPPSWKFTSCNASALKLFDVKDKAEFTSLGPWDLSPQFQPNGSPSGELAPKNIKKAMQEGSHFFEWTHKRLNGEDFSATVLLTRMELAGHAMLQATVRDITEQKNLEVQLTQARKLEAVGQLAAGIAHEINTPVQYVGDNTRFFEEAFGELNKVIGQYERLHECVKAGKPADDLVREIEEVIEEADIDYLKEEVPAAIEQTLKGVEHVAKIVRSMKEFSHPGVKEKTSVDINHAIENTVMVSRNEWKYVAEIKTDLDISLPLVLCLASELNQVFLNLIINAAQAIEGVVGKGSVEKGVINISTRKNNDFVEIRITDTGPGIPKEIQSRIFDPFFTTKDVGKGTGQGLAIARSVIVEKHGGELSIKTKTGKGAAFIIRLPIKAGTI